MDNEDKARICKFIGWPLLIIGILNVILPSVSLLTAFIYNPSMIPEIVGALIGVIVIIIIPGYYLVRKAHELEGPNRKKLKFRWLMSKEEREAANS